LAVYTDPTNTPAVIASRLLERGQTNWSMIVMGDLDTPQESIFSGSLSQAAVRSFSNLNLTILELAAPHQAVKIGAKEEAYAHTSGLITKAEIRSVALGLLELTGIETFWDLGSGSGSVAIEAGRLLGHGELWAVEKDPQRIAQIQNNRSLYGAAHLEIVAGNVLEVLGLLPDPDRVFIGGGGKNLEQILKAAHQRLKPGGILVAAVVKIDSLNITNEVLAKFFHDVELTQVWAARSYQFASSSYFKPLNPVWLIKGKNHY
jgi:precorrin-6Y C5,15-methyltransferase (decarboxylating)